MNIRYISLKIRFIKKTQILNYFNNIMNEYLKQINSEFDILMYLLKEKLYNNYTEEILDNLYDLYYLRYSEYEKIIEMYLEMLESNEFNEYNYKVLRSNALRYNLYDLIKK